MNLKVLEEKIVTARGCKDPREAIGLLCDVLQGIIDHYWFVEE